MQDAEAEMTTAASTWMAEAEVEAQMESNPLLAEWTGPYQGVPDFNAASLEDLEPALEAGMAAHLAEIDAIANNPESPTFENTIVAMERADRPRLQLLRYLVVQCLVAGIP